VLTFLQRERANLKGRWSILLVLVTCCVVTLLVAQQGDTIDRQRNLIQVLWGDSKELNHLKVQELVNRHNQVKPAPDNPTAAKPPAKPKAEKPRPKDKASERQAIEKPGPRLLRYI
jgi:hypothetical protein